MLLKLSPTSHVKLLKLDFYGKLLMCYVALCKALFTHTVKVTVFLYHLKMGSMQSYGTVYKKS